MDGLVLGRTRQEEMRYILRVPAARDMGSRSAEAETSEIANRGPMVQQANVNNRGHLHFPMGSPTRPREERAMGWEGRLCRR
jgi:hypothetical protein